MMSLNKKILILTAGLLLCSQAKAQMEAGLQALPFDKEVVKGTLPNGMTYYIQHNENPKGRAFFYIAQKVGSVQEDEDQRGLAHFLEHMCFNGSDHFKGNGVVNFCQRIGVQFGADLNAYTAADRTVYNINNVPTADQANLDSCLFILYDWANGLTLDPKEIDKERGVIHEEWRMRSGAYMRILERQLETIMPGSKYGKRLPIGLMSVIDNFEPQTLRNYYEKWYRPDLQGLVIVGDIDVKAMEKKVKDLFSPIEKAKSPAKFEYFEVPKNDQPIFAVDKDKEVTSPIVMFMIKHDQLPREYRNTAAALPMNYIINVLCKMYNYRFDDLKQNPEAPFNVLEMSDGPFLLANNQKALSFEMVPKDGKTKEAVADLTREIVRVGKYGFNYFEYDRAKKQFLSDLDQARDARKTIKSEQLVNECVEHFLENELKTDFETEYQIYQQIAQALPIDMVNGVAKELVGTVDTNVVCLAMYPERENYEVPTAQLFSQTLSEVKAEDIQPYESAVVDTKLIDNEPKAGKIKNELPADNFGYKTLELSNGIKVLYKKTDFDEAKILFTAVSKGGNAKLPLEQMDNVAVFDDVMADNGLGKFNSNDLRKALTGRQVSLAPSLGHLSESLSGFSSPKDLRTLMQLIYLQFTEISYDTLNYRNVIKQEEQALANRNANPLSAFQDSIMVRIANNNPRQQPMTLQRLTNVNYDQILQIAVERFGAPNDFTFIFTGNVDEDSLRLLASQYLASLPVNNQSEDITDDGVRLWTGNQLCRFEKKMETPITYMLQVWNGKYENNVKNRAVALAAGGVLDDIYLKSIREEHSFAYSVNASIGMQDMPESHFILQTIAPVTPEKTDSALALIDEGLKQLAEKPAPADVLAKTKEQMLKSYENSLRENSYWQGLAVTRILFGRDGFTGYKEAIEAVTPEDVQAFVRDVVLKQNNRLNLLMTPAAGE